MNSFLWKIRRAPRHPPSYLFGTIHVPYTRVWDFIPERSKRAFHGSHSVFFELDLTDPLTISKLTSCQLLPHGENLQKLLPRDLYRRLKRHLDYVKHMMPSWMTADQRGRGLYADYLFNAIAGNWERKRPVWVMLMVNSLTEWDVRSRGTPVLDLFLAQEAERMGKTTGAVERVEEQCHPLNGLNFSQVGRRRRKGGTSFFFFPLRSFHMISGAYTAGLAQETAKAGGRARRGGSSDRFRPKCSPARRLPCCKAALQTLG